MLSLASLFFAIAGCGGKVIGGAGGSGGTGGGAGDFAACTGPGQCVLAYNGCCGICGEADLASMVAINSAQAAAFHQQVCPIEPPCVACDTIPNPNFFAYCDNGTCRAADTRTHAVSACSADADCALRAGTDCCEPCMPSDAELTSVNKTSNFASLVCAQSQACDLCLTQYPPDAAAICDAGHCGVTFAALPGGG